MAEIIMRRPAVTAMTGLPRSTIYYLMQHSDFPRQIKLGPRASGWLKSEIEAWIQQRIEHRGAA